MLIYCLSMPFRSGEQMFSPLLKSTGKLNVLITNIFITFAILTPCFYFIGKSPELMALAWLIGFTISYTITTARSCKAIGLSIVEKWRNITLPFVAGGIMLVLVYATGDYLQSSGIFEPVSLLIQILIGAVSYIGVLICIKRELVFELLSLVRGKLK
nr:polysaccharide biosynthesis C-terminal domain-containing protein [Aestuariibacter sp. A3R04]